MIVNWFSAGQAVEVGAALADKVASSAISGAAPDADHRQRTAKGEALQEILQRADRELRELRLNFYKRAKLANSFKWRLLEKGVGKQLADEVTQTLILHLSVSPAGVQPNPSNDAAVRRSPGDAKQLLAQGDRCMITGAYAEAVDYYQELVELEPRHAVAINNLGAALSKLGHYQEAEDYFRQATAIKPDYSDAYSNLGISLQSRGYFAEAETALRRALKLNPTHVNARVNLGLVLAELNRSRESRGHFRKVLKAAPRNVDALVGMSYLAKTDGHFDESASLLERALEINPDLPNALAGLAGLRKMTAADGPWVERAEKLAAGRITPLEEAELRFAIGKFFDDVGDFKRAFGSYQRANELMKAIAQDYDPDAQTSLVDDLIRVYTPKSIGSDTCAGSDSMQPVLVVGMMRSGTSLTEQIIAAHPAAKGAGELSFWNQAVQERSSDIRQGLLAETARKQLAQAYLRALASQGGDARRIIDKAPINSDYLGIIHSVFPNARFIYMRRDPVDTCLSCYFQKFSIALNFTMDLQDLAHYYKEHRRLMAHWRAVLPPGTILDVPYEELISDQEGWSRKILDFVGLDWDPRCLDFHLIDRPVATASYWQVRQKIYKGSVQRWRNYESFIKPLLALRN
jgi:tetratricopeptide (TPR) repeat protein